MKTKITILLIISLTFNFGINAQEPAKTYHEKMKILMSNLDSTKFKNNILYDKVYPLANLKAFNQNGRKDTSNYKHFKQALYELNLAGNKHQIMKPEMLEQLAMHGKNHNQVQIGIMNVDMTTIKENAYDENNKLIEIDSTGQYKKMVEVIGKDPYRHIQSLVISPLQGKIKEITGESVTFNFSRAFIQKSTNPIFELNVDFGDGQLQPIIAQRRVINPSLSYHFPTEGNKTLKFTGSYQDGTPIETYALLRVVIANTTSGVVKLRATENFTPYIPDESHYFDNYVPDDEHPEIEYKVYYSTNPARTQIMKPIIIVDGIDYDDKRKINDIYDNQLKQKDTGEKLGVKLDSLGYDVIIANFPNYKIGTVEIDDVTECDDWGNPEDWDTEIIDVYRKGGADYIQRNAKAVKELIRTINNELVTNGSNEKLVVVGPSMGGLVTRWALKEMENAGEDHNVRIWVSFDSPHQGANVPIGLQFGASYKGDADALDKLNRKASREMLVYHYLDENNNTVSAGAPNFRNRFKNELSVIGYPQNLRKVALVNGSATGELNNSPNGEFINTDVLAIGYGLLEGQEYLFPSYIRFTRNSGIQNVFELDYPYNFNAYYNKEDIFKRVVNNSQLGSYDNAPGCKFTLSQKTIDDLEETKSFNEEYWLAGFHVNIYPNVVVDNFTFMPTKSTLDFQGTSRLLSEPVCYNLVLSGETPFDSYYAPEHNEEHVELNTDNVTWLLNELDSTDPTDPPVYCTQPNYLSINGPSRLCPTNTVTYTLSPNNLTNVQWTVGGDLTILSSNDQQIVVKMNENTTNSPPFGEITVSDNNFTKTKYVICLPIIDIIHLVGNMIRLKTGNENIPLDQQGITDVTWELTHGTGNINAADNRTADINSNDYYGTVTVTNESGSVTKPFFGPDPDKCYIIKKVNADKYQVIDRCNGYVPLTTMPIKEIYDQYGTKISDAPVINDKIDVSNTGNSGDIRVIRVVVNGENVSKMIIKD